MPRKPTTGLTHQRSATLLNALKPTSFGKSQENSPYQALKITPALYHRHNLTEELLSEFFLPLSANYFKNHQQNRKSTGSDSGPVDSATGMSTRYTKFTGHQWNNNTHLELALISQNKLFRQAQSCWVNHQDTCSFIGTLLAITNPRPDARHDAYAFKKHGLKKYLDGKRLCRLEVPDAC